MEGNPYPMIPLDLTGVDANAFALLGAARRAAAEADVPVKEWQNIMRVATSGDYTNLLKVLMEQYDITINGKPYVLP